LDFDISCGKGLLQILDTIVNVIFAALEKQFDFAVGGISHKAGQVVTAGDVKSGETKANALNAAAEKNMFCDICHCYFPDDKYNTSCLFWQSLKIANLMGKIKP